MQRQFPDTCKKVTSNVVASCILIAQGTERMRQECATVEADLAGSGVSDHLTTPFPAMSELEMLVSM